MLVLILVIKIDFWSNPLTNFLSISYFFFIINQGNLNIIQQKLIKPINKIYFVVPLINLMC